MNQGVVTLNSSLTSTGNATSVTGPKLVSPETTTIGKTTLSALGVGILRQVTVAANMIIGSFPTKSFAVAGDRTQVVLPSMAAFADAFEVIALEGTNARRQWDLVVNPYTVAGGDGAAYAALSEEQRIAWDAMLEPGRGSATLEQMIALAIDNTPYGKACVVTFDQSNNHLKVGYGTEGNLDTYKALVTGLTIAADKQVIACNFADEVIVEGTDGGFLE